MRGSDVGLLLIERARYILIHGRITRVVDAIVDFLHVNAVIFPCILGFQLGELGDADVASLLHLRKQTIVEARPSIQGSDFLFGQLVRLVLGVDDDVPSFHLFVDFVVSVVRLWLFLCLLGESEGIGLCSGDVILRVVVIWAWFVFGQLEWLGCGFPVDGSARTIQPSPDIEIQPSPFVVESLNHHHQSTPPLVPCQFPDVEVLLPDDWAIARFEVPVELEGDGFPIDHLQPFPHLVLLFFGNVLFGLLGFGVDDGRGRVLPGESLFRVEGDIPVGVLRL